jgi:RNA polymerase sigma-70 factor, ECF subfamily
MKMEQTSAVERTEPFAALVERHSRLVFRLAYRMTGNEQDAEDVVQETFLRAYKQLASYDGRAGFQTWVTRIAVNCSIDLLRARNRRGTPVPLDSDSSLSSGGRSPEQAAFDGQVRQRLAVAMARLTPVERAAFILRHYEGARVDEIARAIDKPGGATRHCIFRAVQKLREALEPMMAGVAESPSKGIPT